MARDLSTTPEEMHVERLLVSTQTMYTICQTLTGYGTITGLTAEGEIEYELSGADAYEVGRQAAELAKELEAYDTGVLVQRQGRAN